MLLGGNEALQKTIRGVADLPMARFVSAESGGKLMAPAKGEWHEVEMCKLD